MEFVVFVTQSLMEHLPNPWQCVLAVLSLERSAGALAAEMELLRDMMRDVESMAAAGGRLTSRVGAWLHRVEQLADEVAGFQEEVDRTGCLCFFRYNLHLRAAEYRKMIEELKVARIELGVLVGKEAVLDASPIVGMEQTLSAVRRHLRSDDVRVIGICGMGGVGKTTLMKKVNNEFLVVGAASMFDVVIMVSVSKDPAIHRIQEDIGVQLGLPFSANQRGSSQGDVAKQARILFNALLKKRFLLLLDDLWQPIDLSEIGFPVPSYIKDSKIVIASRSDQVCYQMGVDVTVRMRVLDLEDSWKLFHRSVGGQVLMSPDISFLASSIVQKCGGLPLALITVGQSLSNVTRVEEWRHAVQMLSESSTELPGLGMERVLRSLKLSFDRLEDVLQQCLLYCSLFPEEHNINIEELIEYWTGEGLLHGDDTRYLDNIDVVRNKGRAVIKRLETVCFLENSAGEDEMYVKMHDMVRDLIMWVSGQDCRSVNMAGRKLSNFLNVDKWHGALRISLMDCEIEDFPELPYCPNLKTLLLNRNAHLTRIRNTIFSFMPELRVLDLSGTGIGELPNEIGMLIELRYLNLSDTPVRSLPTHIGKLSKLELLNLGYTKELVTIPQEGIVALAKLQKLNLYNSSYCWTSKTNEYGERGVILKDLMLLNSLNDLRLDVNSLPTLVEILESKKLSGAIRYLTLQHVKFSPNPPPDFNSMNNLRELCIHECSSLEELAFRSGRLHSLEVLSLLGLSITKMVIEENALQRLRNLHILGCHMLKDLTPIHQLPRLERIDLRVCHGLMELISAPLDEDSFIFPRLRSINLYALPSFKRIYRHPLLLPSLEYLEVYGCPMFMKLPLDSHSAKNIKQILGMKKWWESLQWDEQSTRLKFHCFFMDPWQEEEEKDNEEEGEEEAEDMSKRRQEQPRGEGARETTN